MVFSAEDSSSPWTAENRLRRSKGSSSIGVGKSDNVHVILCAADPVEAAHANQPCKGDTTIFWTLTAFQCFWEICPVSWAQGTWWKVCENFFSNSFCMHWPESDSFYTLLASKKEVFCSPAEMLAFREILLLWMLVFERNSQWTFLKEKFIELLLIREWLAVSWSWIKICFCCSWSQNICLPEMEKKISPNQEG